MQIAAATLAVGWWGFAIVMAAGCGIWAFCGVASLLVDMCLSRRLLTTLQSTSGTAAALSRKRSRRPTASFGQTAAPRTVVASAAGVQRSVAEDAATAFAGTHTCTASSAGVSEDKGVEKMLLLPDEAADNGGLAPAPAPTLGQVGLGCSTRAHNSSDSNFAASVL